MRSVYLCTLCVGAQFEWILDTVGHCVCVSLSAGGCEEMYSEMQMLKIASGYAECRKKKATACFRLKPQRETLQCSGSPCLV